MIKIVQTSKWLRSTWVKIIEKIYFVAFSQMRLKKPLLSSHSVTEKYPIILEEELIKLKEKSVPLCSRQIIQGLIYDGKLYCLLLKAEGNEIITNILVYDDGEWNVLAWHLYNIIPSILVKFIFVFLQSLILILLKYVSYCLMVKIY